jgi:hypothetical protein
MNTEGIELGLDAVETLAEDACETSENAILSRYRSDPAGFVRQIRAAIAKLACAAVTLCSAGLHGSTELQVEARLFR